MSRVKLILDRTLAATICLLMAAMVVNVLWQVLTRFILATPIALTVLVFALAVLLGGGIRLVWISFALGQTSGALQIPLGYVYLVVPVSGVCVVFYAVGWLLEARSGQSASATQSGALN